MYSELVILMKKCNVKITDISQVLHLNRNTISDKIKGKTKFTIEEIEKIRNAFFPSVSLDELCKKI